MGALGAAAVIPIGDSPRTSRTPWVNLLLIAVNIAAFLYELALGADLDPLFNRWGVVPARIDSVLSGSPGADLSILATLVTATFLHAGWLHLGGNMLFLWIFGDNVEDRLGHAPYLAFYLVCGIFANLAQVEVDPTSVVPSVGASGAIAGVLGAYAVTFPGARVSVLVPILFFWVLDLPALLMIGFWFITQFFSGVAALTSASMQSAGIAWWAHVGGFACGIVLMVILPKYPDPSRKTGSGLQERARADTGLVGLAIGSISLGSQLLQFALGIRAIAIFLGLRGLGQLTAPIVEIVRLTTPLVAPIEPVIPGFQIAGRLVESYTVVAMVVVYLLGSALVWGIAASAFQPGRR